MKTKTTLSKTILIFTLLFAIVRANALEIQLSPTMYAGGYNISCHGSNNGAINTYVLDGTGPFTFVWSNGATSKNISNLTAGAYTVTVTASNGETAIGQIDLIEPELFIADLTPEDKGNGYQISEFGGTDGNIHSQITGGVPPYNFLWSNGSTTETIENLSEGTYTVVVHDATNCITSATVTLLEPTELHLVSITSPKVIGNYNIGCSLPGSISVNIAGGIPPYIYEWENGENTQTLNDLFDEGDYGVLVRDENGAEVRTNIILTRSPVLSATVSAFVYSNNKNTSCYNCNNGSINTTISSGTSPYTFVWNNGASVKNPNNLSAGVYSVIISDAAGCITEKTAILMAPEREDWAMKGNALTNDSTDFLGTTDQKDFVFKSNNTEAMRLLSSGGTKFTGDLFSNSFKLGTPTSNTTLAESVISGSTRVLSFGGTPSVYRAGSPAEPIHPWVSQNQGPYDVICTTPTPSTDDLFVRIQSDCYQGNIDNWHYEGGIANANRPLLLNWYSGNDVGLCSNPNAANAGGTVSTGWTFEVGHPTKDLDVAANIRGHGNRNGLKVVTLDNPEYNTQLSVHDVSTKIIGGSIFNSQGGWYQDIFSIKGDGETRIGSTISGTTPSLFITPSFDAGTNSYLTGKIGIGTSTPRASLQVGEGFGNNISLGQYVYDWNITGRYFTSYFGFNATRNPDPNSPSTKWTLRDGAGGSVITSSLNGDIRFISIPTSGDPNNQHRTMTDTQIADYEKMIIRNDGKIGIGSPVSYPGSYNLYVTGGILTEKLKIALGASTEWMDKVFEKEYKLRSLSDLEDYISTNKHLPEIPTTADVQKEGIDIASMITKLLQKNEELTLYVIQMNKEKEALQERVQLLEKSK